MKASQLGERKLITKIARKFRRNRLIIYGDDAAAIPLGDKYLLFCIDTMNEGADIPRWLTPVQIGMASATSSLSDIAAMGGTPHVIIVSFTFLSSETVERIEGICEGIERVARKSDCFVVGGDVNCGEELSISVAALGEVKKNQILLRSQAKIGDVIAVIGDIGGFNAAFCSLNEGLDLKPEIRKKLMKELAPKPRTMEGKAMASDGLVSACIDLSDGLFWGLWEICKCSRVGAFIYEEKLPLTKETLMVSNMLGISREDIVVGPAGGFELIVTLRPQNWKTFQKKMLKRKIEVFEIGKITKKGSLLIQRENGVICNLKKKGYEHFRSKPL